MLYPLSYGGQIRIVLKGGVGPGMLAASQEDPHAHRIHQWTAF